MKQSPSSGSLVAEGKTIPGISALSWVLVPEEHMQWSIFLS